MPAQTSPFIETKYGWAFGEGGWNIGADENWLKLGYLLDNNVDGVVSSLPAIVNGEAYFLTTDNRFYFAVNSTWYSSPCPEWFLFKVRSTGLFWWFTGTTAVEINNPQQANDALQAIQDVIDTLGTAAFVSLDSLATQAELDVAVANAAAYTDDLRADIASTVSSEGADLVGFKQVGTGAVDRTVFDKLGEIVSVKDFGAVGDGVADDTAEFILAVATNKQISIPYGTYNLTSDVEGYFVPELGVSFNGSGRILQKARGFHENVGSGVNVHRLLDRVFVGDVVINDAHTPATDVSWLGKTDYVAPNGSLQPGLAWMENNATFASYASRGSIGVAGAAHTAEMTGGSAIGLVGAAVNDNPTYYSGAYAAYLDAKSYANAAGSVFGVEIAVANLGTYVDQYETTNNRKTYGILLAAGADETINGLNDSCTSAINIGNNGADWGVGITFGSSSLRTKTYRSANYNSAITLRANMWVGWESSVGGILNYVKGYSSGPTTATGINLRSNGIEMQGADAMIALFDHVSSAVNSLQFSNSATGSPVVVRAAGTDTNIDIDMYPKGTGDLRIHKSFANATTPASFAANKIIQIRDFNGTIHYVPAMTAAW